jgi:hypothetical protein
VYHSVCRQLLISMLLTVTVVLGPMGAFSTVGVSTAQATLIQNDFGLSSQHQTITFDEHIYPSMTGITTQYSDLGVTFAPFVYYAPYGTSNVSNFAPSGFGGSRFPITMSFTAPQTEVAFQLQSGGTAYFNAYLGSTLVEADTFIVSSGHYYGFSDISFDTISFYTYDSSGDPWGAGWVYPVIIDNIEIGTSSSAPVPEPSTIFLLGVGLAGLVSFRKKFKRT